MSYDEGGLEFAMKTVTNTSGQPIRVWGPRSESIIPAKSARQYSDVLRQLNESVEPIKLAEGGAVGPRAMIARINRTRPNGEPAEEGEVPGTKHNHLTREIRAEGKCEACDNIRNGVILPYKGRDE